MSIQIEVILLKKHILAIIFVMIGTVYFFVASFIHLWDNHLYQVPYDMRSLWVWFIGGWILLQIIIVSINYGNRYKYKFALQFLTLFIVMVFNNTIISIAYYRDQGILDMVPFHDSYAGFLYLIILIIIAGILLKKWIKTLRKVA
jgi:hypothetical protein